MYQAQFFATTSADWAQAIELIDADTNLPFEIPEGTTFELDVRGRGGYQSLTRTTAEGTIETPGGGIVQWRFPATDLTNYCLGTYQVGLTMTTDGGTVQLLLGSLSILDGEVR